MGREIVITNESFDALLDWLDPNRDIAAHKYEAIRSRLIRIFISKGSSAAEDLADLTIDRVIAKLPDIRADYAGDPAGYFHGVARKIYLESLRRKEIGTETFTAPAAETTDTETEYECLSMCLNLLPPQQRELVLDYYINEKQAKIDHRKELAQRLGLTALALRLKAHRTRATLKKCVVQCVKGKH